MIDFMTQNATYVVLAITLILWAGISMYIQRIDFRLRDVEQKTKR